MPRKDRTFSDRDVIRIVVKHLEPQEQVNVQEFMRGFTAQEFTMEAFEAVLQIIGLIPLVGEFAEVLNLVLDFTQALQSQTRRILAKQKIDELLASPP
jgi:hypothetical protein